MSFCPICHNEIGTWTDDPIKTPKGLAGEDYKGVTILNWSHIKELQVARTLQEQEAGIAPVSFSEINPTILIQKKHILELRQSTENLISNIGSDLLHYFNYRIEDHEEVYIGTYEYGVKVADKTNWTDPDLENIKKLKAIHIEELRHLAPIAQSIAYNMEDRLTTTPTFIYINTACYAYPHTTEIKAYWGVIDVTEKAGYTVSSGDIEIIKASGKVFIKANGQGSVKVSFVPPGFLAYVQDAGSINCSYLPGGEEREACELEWYDTYFQNTEVTVNITRSYYLSYSGELKGTGLLERFPEIRTYKLYGSGNPTQCSGDAFSWDDVTSLTYGINGHWKCDFTNRVYLERQSYETCFTSAGLSFEPVSSYLFGTACPNPNGITSGDFSEYLIAKNNSTEVCDGYWFNFGWSKTVSGNWYYVKTMDDGEWINLLKIVTNSVKGTPTWWATFSAEE